LDVHSPGTRLERATLARKDALVGSGIFRLIGDVEAADAIRQLAALVPLVLATRPLMPVAAFVAVAALEGAEDLCGTVERLAHAVSRQHGGDDGMVCVWVEVVVLEVSPFVGAGVGVPVARPVYASGLVVGAPRKHVLDVVASFRVVCSDLDAGGEAGQAVIVAAVDFCIFQEVGRGEAEAQPGDDMFASAEADQSLAF
jgi:hypothetical protein